MTFMEPPAGMRREVRGPKWTRIGLYCQTHGCHNHATWGLQFEHNGRCLTLACEDHKDAQAKEWKN